MSELKYRPFEEYWGNSGARKYCETHEERAHHAWNAGACAVLELLMLHEDALYAFGNCSSSASIRLARREIQRAFKLAPQPEIEGCYRLYRNAEGVVETAINTETGDSYGKELE